MGETVSYVCKMRGTIGSDGLEKGWMNTSWGVQRQIHGGMETSITS